MWTFFFIPSLPPYKRANKSFIRVAFSLFLNIIWIFAFVSFRLSFLFFFIIFLCSYEIVVFTTDGFVVVIIYDAWGDNIRRYSSEYGKTLRRHDTLYPFTATPFYPLSCSKKNGASSSSVCSSVISLNHFRFSNFRFLFSVWAFV